MSHYELLTNLIWSVSIFVALLRCYFENTEWHFTKGIKMMDLFNLQESLAQTWQPTLCQALKYRDEHVLTGYVVSNATIYDRLDLHLIINQCWDWMWIIWHNRGTCLTNEIWEQSLWKMPAAPTGPEAAIGLFTKLRQHCKLLLQNQI